MILNNPGVLFRKLWSGISDPDMGNSGSVTPAPPHILLEDGSDLLLEDGSLILLE